MKEELAERFYHRGNSQDVIKENSDKFEEYRISNCKENKSAVHYEFHKGEYLEDIIKKFGFKF